MAQRRVTAATADAGLSDTRAGRDGAPGGESRGGAGALRLVPPSLRSAVEDQIRQAILSGALPPGTHLSDRVMCERFGVSRTIVREAVRLLEAEGLVSVLPRRGPFVAFLSAAEAVFVDIRPGPQPPESARQRTFHAERGMDQRAQREEPQPRLAIGIVVIVGAVPRRYIVEDFFVLEARAFTQADRGAEQQDCADCRADRHRDQSGLDARQQAARQGHDHIAEDATEAGRQRPMRRDGHQRGNAGSTERAQEQEGQTRADPRQAAVGEQRPPPERQRDHDGDRRKAEHLHQEIGDDRAGAAQPVVNRGGRRMIEARVLDRPGHQGEAEGHEAGEQGRTGGFGEPPRDKQPNRFGDVVESRRARRRSHRSPPAALAPQTRQERTLGTG